MPERTRLIAENACRLDVYASAHTELSRSAVQRMIRLGQITVNGGCAKASFLLSAGDSIEIEHPEPQPTDVQPEEMQLSILYEDSALAVIDKPQGMVVHPSAGHASGTLVNGLLYLLDGLSGVGGELRPGIVHRIDRMTSGLLVVAKNDASHRALSEQFRDHSARRSYLAIAEGGFHQDGGTVDAAIGRHPVDRKRMAVTDNGRAAVTHWRVLERMHGYTLLQLELETGRTHQIRVHLAWLGHPIAGDVVYGRAKPQLGLDGQALHGYRLTFCHPETHEPMTFFAPIPTYFLSALQRAGMNESTQALWERLKRLPDTRKEHIQ